MIRYTTAILIYYFSRHIDGVTVLLAEQFYKKCSKTVNNRVLVDAKNGKSATGQTYFIAVGLLRRNYFVCFVSQLEIERSNSSVFDKFGNFF